MSPALDKGIYSRKKGLAGRGRSWQENKRRHFCKNLQDSGSPSHLVEPLASVTQDDSEKQRDILPNCSRDLGLWTIRDPSRPMGPGVAIATEGQDVTCPGGSFAEP